MIKKLVLASSIAVTLTTRPMHDVAKIVCTKNLYLHLRYFSQNHHMYVKDYKGFFNGLSKEEIKKKFFQEVKKAHPDHGGDHASFCNLKNEFEAVYTRNFTNSQQTSSSKSHQQESQQRSYNYSYQYQQQQEQSNYGHYKKETHADNEEKNYEHERAWSHARNMFHKLKSKWLHAQERYLQQQRAWNKAQQRFKKHEKEWQEAQRKFNNAQQEYTKTKHGQKKYK